MGILEVKTPMAILGAETDNLAPPELLKQLGDILSAKGEVYLSKKKLIVWKRKKMNWVVVFFFCRWIALWKYFRVSGMDGRWDTTKTMNLLWGVLKSLTWICWTGLQNTSSERLGIRKENKNLRLICCYTWAC